MTAFAIWGNQGNTAYAMPMVALTPVDPATMGQMLYWDTVNQGLNWGGITIDASTLDAAFTGHANLAANKVYKINNVQVVGAQRSGWTTAPTGTATRTTFDTATVTLSQLAERVKALLDDLRTHGLIGA